MFDCSSVADRLTAFDGLDRRRKPLLGYRQFDYWVYEEHRNAVQMVAHLAGARQHLDPRIAEHVALVLDLARLHLLSLIRMTGHIRGAFLGDPDLRLQEYIFGGATNLREKVETARLLNRSSPEGTGPLDHLPPYYAPLRELVPRLPTFARPRADEGVPAEHGGCHRRLV
ncbi:hypothetical protein SAMN05660642_03072 [Geodermatophilus siccatus]|uniref:Uncharacterized protein n=1 Tax=Geodermatophilus siccatus TaxID=1137991 RepID=A0A1G9VBZ6_9ACTN|nr:hypothetical protein SAMN05660642_03072 [Geodermatophilus siccatus]